MTGLQSFFQRWGGCERCPLHKGRRHVVLCRGTVPCDAVYIGEAPGESENALGYPFAGPAGHLMDSVDRRAFATYPQLTRAFTNIVCCIPRDKDGDKLSEPDDDDIQSCGTRLREFITLCSPRLIVAVGSVARDYLEPGWKHSLMKEELAKIKQVHIMHPSAILRANVVQRSLLIQRCVVVLRTALEKIAE